MHCMSAVYVMIAVNLLLCISAGYSSAQTNWEYEVVDSTITDYSYSSLVFDAQYNPCIAYYNIDQGTSFSFGDLRYATKCGGNWLIEEIVTDSIACFTGYPPSLAIDSQGQPHIAYVHYVDGSGIVSYASKSGGIWTIESVESGAWQPCLALDNQDNPHIICWLNGTTNLRYCYKPEDIWVRNYIDHPGRESGRELSLKLDQQGDPHISFNGKKGWTTRELRYAHLSSGTWSVDTLHVSGVGNPSIVLDRNENPHICSYGGVSGLYYHKKSGEEWITNSVDGSVYAGCWISFALDSQDRPSTIYQECLSYSLNYAHKDNDSWSIEKILCCSGGYKASLAIDAEDLSHFTFFNREDKDLIYAKIMNEIAVMIEYSSAAWVNDHIEIIWSIVKGFDESGLTFDVSRSDDGGTKFSNIPDPIIQRDGDKFSFSDYATDFGSKYIYQVTVFENKRPETCFNVAVKTPSYGFNLSQNYPNPFNPITNVTYYVPERCHTTFEIFDISGLRIICLVDKYEEKGNYTVSWDGKDIEGKSVSSGIYFYRVTAGKKVISKKMVLLK